MIENTENTEDTENTKNTENTEDTKNNETSGNTVKKLCLPVVPENNKKTVEKTLVQKKKRVVTTSNQWTGQVSNLSIENQWHIIRQLHGDLSRLLDLSRRLETEIPVATVLLEQSSLQNHCEFASKEIHRKIYGYKSQDIDKKILDETKLVTFKYVIELLFQVNNKCFYCKENVAILYEYVREPKQWTLDRLDNDFGHNHDNVVIACLNCNLRRKTMYHERFVFTKQLHIVKKT